METVIWLIVTLPCAVFFTGLGIFAWRRKKPMWFWSGSTVNERDISDVPAYNRANGIMWICFSLVFWVAVFLGLFRTEAAGVVLGVGCIAGIPVLVIAYGRIFRRYKK